MGLSPDEVQARKRRLLYLLLQYRTSYLRKFTDAESRNAQNTTLEEALEDLKQRNVDLPIRCVKDKANGGLMNGGAHDVDSLRAVIHTAVREHGYPDNAKHHAVDLFFKKGRHAMKDDYYHLLVEAQQAHVDRVPHHASKTIAETDIAVVQETPPPSDPIQISKRQQGGAKCNVPSYGTARSILREIEQLNEKSSVHGPLTRPGSRKRFCCERLGFPDLQVELNQRKAPAKQKLEQNRSERNASSKRRAEPPFSLADAACNTYKIPDDNEDDSKAIGHCQQVPAHGTAVLPPPTSPEEQVQSDAAVLPARMIVPAAVVRDYTKKIDRYLQPRLRRAFDESGMDWKLPAKFLTRPSVGLRNLYQVVMGRNWHTSMPSSSLSEETKALYGVVALVGAGIYSQILTAAPCGSGTSLGTLGSCYERSYAEHMFGEKENYGFETRLRKCVLDVAKDEGYRRTLLRPLAQAKAAAIETAVYEHLSAEPVYAAVIKIGRLSDGFHEAITNASETAMMLADELHASGEYVQPTWFEGRQRFDSERMSASIHANEAEPDDSLPQDIDMTLLPGIEIAHSDGSWGVYAHATVHRSSSSK